MPTNPPHPCRWPGCAELTSGGSFCQIHQRQSRQREDRGRGTAAQRGYTSRWRTARARYLSEHPLCVLCESEGRVTAAEVVDHIRPHRGDMDLFWDEDNWQSLCKQHHDAKTASRDGAFGNRAG